MNEFIEFGWNVIGFMAALIFGVFALSIFWGLMAGIIESIAAWMDRNGIER